MELKLLIGLIVGGVALVIFFMALLSRYKRCTANQILVVSGKTGKNIEGETRSAKCIHGGATFVMPITQEYKYKIGRAHV